MNYHNYEKQTYALLQQAYHLSLSSTDPSTQLGAVLVSEKGQRCPGYNRPYEGADLKCYMEDSTYRHSVTVHAEVEAIMCAARWGVPTAGATLYCPWACCHGCAKSIIAAGIEVVVRHAPLHRFSKAVRTGAGTAWATSIRQAEEALENAGVEVVDLEQPIDAPPIRHAGVLFDPRTLKQHEAT